MIMLFFGLIKIFNLSKNELFEFFVSIKDSFAVLVSRSEILPTLISKRSFWP